MTRVGRGAVFLLACAIAFAGLPGGGAYAQSFDPQPYLVYEMPPEPLQPPALVDLEDQFNLWKDVPVLERWFFMNPVEKLPLSPPGDPEQIMQPDLHYRWYTIDVQGGAGTRIVQVTNQFGNKLPWEIESAPEFLLAPASKIVGEGEPGPPTAGQHYDCYVVVNAPPAMVIVNMEDQFGTHGPSDVLDARYLCAPTEKTKDQTVYPGFVAWDGRDHLACYDVTPEPHSELISTRDQFTGVEPDQSVALNDKMLCVPSEKTFEKVPSLAPWSIATLGLLLLLTVFWVAQRRARHGKPA